VIVFGSVRFLSKKITKLKLLFFWKKTETEPKPGQTDRFQFGFLGQKPVWLVFPVLARFFPVWLGFFLVFCRFRFGSVFLVFCYKTETEPAGFFKNLIGFFFRFGFFSYFFSGFLGLIGFPVFLLTPKQ
jgi:hypothetical protein